MSKTSPFTRLGLVAALILSTASGCFLDTGDPLDGQGMDTHVGAIAAAGQIYSYGSLSCTDNTTWVFSPLSLDPDHTDGNAGIVTDRHRDVRLTPDLDGYCYSRSFAPRLRLGRWRVSWQVGVGVVNCDVDINQFNHVLIDQFSVCRNANSPGF